MLHGLGHNAVIRGDDQHRQIDTAGTGQHIFDKFLMSGNVYHTGLGAIGPIQMGKAQLDGNAPLFLLDQAVGINARERFHQQRLAVVHMSGGADDHMLHFRLSFKASTIVAKSDSNRVRTSSKNAPSWIRPITGISP